MNEYLLGMLLDGSDQLQGETLHLAFFVVGGVLNVALIVVGFLLRRDLQRSDEEKQKLEGEVDKLRDKHGYEINDIKVAVAPLFTKAGLDQPNYPSR